MKHVIYATAQDTESAFYDALEKSDLDTMMSVWADEDDIVCVHPGGVRSSGVAQVREAWRRIFACGQQLQFRLQYQQVITSGTLAVHSIYEEILIIGEKRTLPPVISTNIYLRTEHGWRMIVHHASAAPAAVESDPRRTSKILH
jgi:ketosteroid isomerase-like protein